MILDVTNKDSIKKACDEIARTHGTLYGVVNSAMDKQIAGMRAGQLFGAFSVENKLEVVKG